MAVEIGRSFDEISKKIKELNSDIKSARTEVRQLDQVLRLDPSNVELATKRIEQMDKAVADTSKKLILLRQQQDQAVTDFKEGRISTKDYEKITNAARRAETELRVLELQTKKLREESARANFDKLNAGLEKTQKVAGRVSKALLGVYAGLAAVFTMGVKTADELGDISQKYSITAEQLQIQRHLYDKITESADGYEKALSSLSSIMSSVARGRGAAYVELLDKLGVSATTLEGKTKPVGLLYEEIFASLQKLTDETERASIANALFGENGYNVAIVAGTQAAEINKLNETLIENGIITTEQTRIAGEIDDKMNDLKIQFMATAVSLAESLQPAFEAIAQILKEVVIPIIAGLASWFGSLSEGQQKILLLLTGLLIILPKIIAFVKILLPIFALIKAATIGQTAATAGLATASVPLIPIFAAIAAALVLIITLMALFSKSAKDTVKSLGDVNGQMAQIQNTSAGVVVTNETLSKTSQTKDLNIDLKVDSTGDTPISQENADIISESLVDKIDLMLGGAI